MIEVMQGGMLTTVQDEGRCGFGKYGVPVGGAMDWFSFRLANLLVGNAPNSAALEATLSGPVLRFQEDSIFAVTGADMAPHLDGAAVPLHCACPAKAGSLLELGSASNGVRSYIAVRGGIDVPLVMGSRSTSLQGAFGGLEGRALRPGDRLPVGPAAPLEHLRCRFVSESFGMEAEAAPLRVLLGPQENLFTHAGLERFLSSAYRVGQNDRMGYRLEGPRPEYRPGEDGNIISDGVALGSIQVSEKVIVMMADHQTVGGYAKLGSVIRADLPRLAQKRSGEEVRFAVVSLQEAQAAYRNRLLLLSGLQQSLLEAKEKRVSLYHMIINGLSVQAEVTEFD